MTCRLRIRWVPTRSGELIFFKFWDWQASHKDHFFGIVMINVNRVAFAWCNINQGEVVSSSGVSDNTDFHHGLVAGIFQYDQCAMVEAYLDLFVTRKGKLVKILFHRLSVIKR